MVGQSMRAAMFVLAVLVLIPLVLVPVYAFIDPVSVPMLVRQIQGRPVERIWRDAEGISDRLKAAVVMSEDGQFCRHWGVDLGALRAEVDDFLAGKPARGASTITMQVARNLFLWNDRSYVRKVLEIPLALYIDLILPKHRIFEIYINIAEWGPDGQFGIEAGTRAAFGKTADALGWDEASLLAVTLPNPMSRHAATPTTRLRRVADIVRKRAQEAEGRIACLYAGRQPRLQ